LQLSREIAAASGPKLVDFKSACHSDAFSGKVKALRQEVEEYSGKFPLPGYGEY